MHDIQKNKKHPDHWWAHIEDPQKPLWEILPNQAERNKNEVILSKRTELGLLSNLAATPFVYKNVTYKSIEGLWQSMKYPDLDDLGAEEIGKKKEEKARAQTRASRSLTGDDVLWVYTRKQVTQMHGFEALYAGKMASENLKKLDLNFITFEGKKIQYKDKDQDLHYQIIFEATLAKVMQNQEVYDLLIKTGNLTLKPDHEQLPNDPPAWRYFEICMKIREQITGL